LCCRVAGSVEVHPLDVHRRIDSASPIAIETWLPLLLEEEEEVVVAVVVVVEEEVEEAEVEMTVIPIVPVPRGMRRRGIEVTVRGAEVPAGVALEVQRAALRLDEEEEVQEVEAAVEEVMVVVVVVADAEARVILHMDLAAEAEAEIAEDERLWIRRRNIDHAGHKDATRSGAYSSARKTSELGFRSWLSLPRLSHAHITFRTWTLKNIPFKKHTMSNTKTTRGWKLLDT
jgi:hypothetical protein